MNTESNARTQIPARLRRWLHTGLLFLCVLALSPAAATVAQYGRIGVAAVCNGTGGGCG